MKTYAIHWKSLINGRTGTGTILFEKDEAERLAEELNRDYPAIHHEAIAGMLSAPMPEQVTAAPMQA